MNGVGLGLLVLGLLLGLLIGRRWFGERRSVTAPATPATVPVAEEVGPRPAPATPPEPDGSATTARITTLEREVTRLRAALREAEARRDGLERALGHAHAELGRRRNGVPYPSADSAPAVRPVAAARPASPSAPMPGDEDDDLTRIKGIGPKLARRLNDLGITSLRQLARLTPDQVARLDAMLDFPGRVARERWIEQAKALLGD